MQSNSQMHWTFHNILMDVTKVSTNNTFGRLLAGQWVPINVNLVMFIYVYAYIERDYLD